MDPTHCTICGDGARAVGTKREFHLYRCQTCLHLFVWPPPGDHLRIYSAEYFSGATEGFGYTDYDRDKEPMVPTFLEYLRRIEAAVGKGTMLDVGAATGFFLNLAQRRGWQVRGVEASDHAASLARAKGLDVHAGTVESCQAPQESFDAVTMWDVIEHLPDPSATMKEVAALVKPGGVVAINTPDSGSALAKLMGTNWHLVVPPEHLNLFHRRSLRVLLEKQGFEVLQTTSLGKRFTLQYIAQTLSHWWKIEPIEGVHRRLRTTRAGQWSVPLNLFDNVFVLARKRLTTSTGA